MRNKFKLMLSVVSAAALTACGGGTGSSHFDPPPARGTIIAGELAVNVSTGVIDAGTKNTGIQALTGAAVCGVDVRYVLYMTRDPQGNPQTASTAVLVPSANGASSSVPAAQVTAQCTGSRPMVMYAHGTTPLQSTNMADVGNNQEAALEMSMYAAQGFIVVMPNYLGYDRSSLHYHPYLNAEAQAVDVVDALRAAKAHLASSGSATQPNGHLFLTGYSQGGFVSMAVHKVIERDYSSEFTVTASGNMSGPYNMRGMGDYSMGVLNGGTPQVIVGASIFFPLLSTSYQKAYGNVYTTPSQIYASPFAATIETILPGNPTNVPAGTTSDSTLSSLYEQQLIATQALPNDPTFSAVFGNPAGTNNLINLSYIATYPGSGFQTDLTTNTLSAGGWAPKAPLALCGGALDETVPYAINVPAMTAYLQSVGVTKTLSVFNLEDPTTVGLTVNGGFEQAKVAYAAANGQQAMLAALHGTLEPPFCNAVTRAYFSNFLVNGS